MIQCFLDTENVSLSLPGQRNKSRERSHSPPYTCTAHSQPPNVFPPQGFPYIIPMIMPSNQLMSQGLQVSASNPNPNPTNQQPVLEPSANQQGAPPQGPKNDRGDGAAGNEGPQDSSEASKERAKHLEISREQNRQISLLVAELEKAKNLNKEVSHPLMYSSCSLWITHPVHLEDDPCIDPLLSSYKAGCMKWRLRWRDSRSRLKQKMLQVKGRLLLRQHVCSPLPKYL